MVEGILKHAREQKPDIIVCLGDVLDSHARMHILPLHRVSYFFNELCDIAETYVLVGNHDRVNNNVYLTTQSSLCAFHNKPNLHIIDDSSKLVEHDNVNALYVPYVPNGRFAETIEQHDLSNVNIIFAHQEFYGVQMGPIKSESGDKWDTNNPYTISGHIHDEQQLQQNIHYVGTPYQLTFSEDPNKGIWLYNITPESRDRTFLPISMPRKQVHKISVYDAIPNITSEEINTTKLVISGTSPEISTYTSSPHYKQLKKAGVKIDFKIITNDVQLNEHKPDRYISYNNALVDNIKSIDANLLNYYNYIDSSYQ
jgi:DNA repair exonuclease SbcCD nuclease subunit